MSQYFDGEASGGGGAVDSVNGQTGVVVLTKSSVGLGNVDNTSDANKPVSTATQTALNAKQATITGGATTITSSNLTAQRALLSDGNGKVAVADTTDLELNRLQGLDDNIMTKLAQREPEINASNGQVIYQNDSDVREGFPGFFRSSTGGISFSNTLPITNSGGFTHHGLSVNLNPTENSPITLTNLFQLSANIDTGLDGFDLGVGGQTLRMITNTISHQGTSDIGSIDFFSNYFNIGNGTDPITCGGIGYMFGFGEFNSGVTIDGPLQGYGFQLNVEAGTTTTSNCYVNPFYDYCNIAVPVNAYTSYSASPIINQINNNNGFSGFNLNPTITTFDGNAGFTGLGIAGNLGTFGTGGYTGISISSTVTDVDNANGLYVNMNNVTASNSKYAIYTEGNVHINGSLAFSGGLSMGQLNAYTAQELADNGGTPASVHFLISSPFIGDNETVANADIIGVNTAALINIGENSVITTAFLGVAALALPAVVSMDSGSTVDRVSGAVFALSLDAGAAGGTISELSLCKALAIPNGATTVTDCIGYKMEFPFGSVGTNIWGVYIAPECDNYLAGSLKVSGTDTVANASVGIELDADDKAVLLSRMDSTERDALTAIDGMIIYNNQTNKFQGYANGSWVDLH